MAISYRLLGPLKATVDGVEARLGGPLQRALLALLVAHRGDTLPSRRLIDDLWDEHPPETAGNLLQGCISDLRKALGHGAIATHGRGYAIAVDDAAADLWDFDRLVEEATVFLDGGDAIGAARTFRDALSLWRGPALADIADHPGAASLAASLDEQRLLAVVRRIDAELASSRHAEVIHELRELVTRNPEHDGLRAQLMLALYRSGRQKEALDAYGDARRYLVDEVGVEPGRQLQELQRAILRQDAELELGAERTAGAERSGQGRVVAVALSGSSLELLLALAVPLCGRPGRELVVTRLVTDGDELAAETSRLADGRKMLVAARVPTRVACFTTRSPGHDAVRLADEHAAEILLVDAPPALREYGDLGADLETVLTSVACDVGIVVTGESGPGLAPGPVVTPFGAGDHDWAAIELAAELAAGLGVSLGLLGTRDSPDGGRRDASRLLARASLLIQEVSGVVAEPRLVAAGPAGIVHGAQGAALLVVGLSDRLCVEGVGDSRLAILQGVAAPTILAQRGVDRRGIRPEMSMTRFGWSIEVR